MRKEIKILNFIFKKKLFNKKGVFFGVFWPENYSSSCFCKVLDTCIFYKSGVKNNRTKKSS